MSKFSVFNLDLSKNQYVLFLAKVFFKKYISWPYFLTQQKLNNDTARWIDLILIVFLDINLTIFFPDKWAQVYRPYHTEKKVYYEGLYFI